MPIIIETYEEFRRRQGAYGQHGEDFEVNPEIVVDGNEHRCLFENGATAVRTVVTTGSPHNYLMDPPTDEEDLMRNQLAFWQARLRRLSNWYSEKVSNMRMSIAMPSIYAQPKQVDFDAANMVADLLPKLREKVEDLTKKLPPPTPTYRPWQGMREHRQRQHEFSKEEFQKLQRRF